jgi:hypothetical protein
MKKIIVLILIVAATWVGYKHYTRPKPEMVTKSGYDQVNIGMNKFFVLGVLGPPSGGMELTPTEGGIRIRALDGVARMPSGVPAKNVSTVFFHNGEGVTMVKEDQAKAVLKSLHDGTLNMIWKGTFNQDIQTGGIHFGDFWVGSVPNRTITIQYNNDKVTYISYCAPAREIPEHAKEKHVQTPPTPARR